MCASLDRPRRREAAWSPPPLDLHDPFFRTAGNYQAQAGGPSGAGPQVPHSLCGQRDAGSNLDLDGMIETPENFRTPSIVSGAYGSIIELIFSIIRDASETISGRQTVRLARLLIVDRPGRREAALSHRMSHPPTSDKNSAAATPAPMAKA